MMLTFTLFAQKENEQEIFKAMQDELHRNKEQLKIPGIPDLYFLSYTIGRCQQFEIAGSLGSIINSYVTPWNSYGGVQLQLGDYTKSSDMTFNCQTNFQKFPGEPDYDIIRRTFWLSTDKMYKQTLQINAMKNAYLQSNPLSEEENALKERCAVPTITRMEDMNSEFSIDKLYLEDLVKKVSLIFKEYHDIYNSSVKIDGANIVFYKTTSEGVVLKLPANYTTLDVSAYIITEDGERIDDSYSILVGSPKELPDFSEIEQGVRKFADHLLKLRTAPVVDQYYNGPVLFRNSAVSSIFSQNLLKDGVLFAYRKPCTNQIRAKETLESRMNTKILDRRLSVFNYTDLKTYKGHKLMGAYDIDAEGIIPNKEMTLIENGIFKEMLNGCVPTLKAPKSTGSSRFMLGYKNGMYATAPGCIHVSTNEGTKEDKMKKELIKAAKTEGLDKAYIVYNFSGKSSEVYQVDIKTGKETLVRLAGIGRIKLDDLNHVLKISESESVGDFFLHGQILYSMIYPSSLLMRDVEIKKMDVKHKTQHILTYPLNK